MKHLGSGCEAEIEALRAACGSEWRPDSLTAASVWGAGPTGPLPLASPTMSHLVDALERANLVLSFDGAADGTRAWDG